MICPQHEATAERLYLDDTLVLRTVFRTAQGEVCLTDALAFAPSARGHQIGAHSPQVLLRGVECLAGSVELGLVLAPSLAYGLTTPHIALDEAGVTMTAGPLELRLLTLCPLTAANDAVSARFTIQLCDGLDVCDGRRPDAEPGSRGVTTSKQITRHTRRQRSSGA